MMISESVSKSIVIMVFYGCMKSGFVAPGRKIFEWTEV